MTQVPIISLILCQSLDRPSRYLREAAAAALSEFVRFRYIQNPCSLSLCEMSGFVIGLYFLIISLVVRLVSFALPFVLLVITYKKCLCIQVIWNWSMVKYVKACAPDNFIDSILFFPLGVLVGVPCLWLGNDKLHSSASNILSNYIDLDSEILCNCCFLIKFLSHFQVLGNKSKFSYTYSWEHN